MPCLKLFLTEMVNHWFHQWDARILKNSQISPSVLLVMEEINSDGMTRRGGVPLLWGTSGKLLPGVHWIPQVRRAASWLATTKQDKNPSVLSLSLQEQPFGLSPCKIKYLAGRQFPFVPWRVKEGVQKVKIRLLPHEIISFTGEEQKKKSLVVKVENIALD